MRLNNKELVVASTLVIMMLSINKNIVQGKRVRKKIVSGIKKAIAIERTKMEVDDYLKLVYKASDFITEAKTSMKLKEADLSNNLHIDPSKLLVLINKTYPDILNKFNISEELLKEFSEVYGKSSLTFVTIMFTNRLLGLIDKEIEVEYYAA